QATGFPAPADQRYRSRFTSSGTSRPSTRYWRHWKYECAIRASSPTSKTAALLHRSLRIGGVGGCHGWPLPRQELTDPVLDASPTQEVKRPSNKSGLNIAPCHQRVIEVTQVSVMDS